MRKIVKAGMAAVLAGSLMAAAPITNAFASTGTTAAAAHDPSVKESSTDATRHDASRDRKQGEKSDGSRDRREWEKKDGSSTNDPRSTKR